MATEHRCNSTTSTNSINVYTASNFRIDINVSTRDGPISNDGYEILMEICTAADGRKQIIAFDAKSLIFLNNQLLLMIDFPGTISQIQCHSIPVCLPRLSFASIEFTRPHGKEFRLYFSGHGSFVEIYSNFTQSWELIMCFDAFPNSKSTVHGLFPSRSNEEEFSLLCVGECEFAFFTAKFESVQMDGAVEEGRREWKRMKFGTFSDWILNGKLLFEQVKNEPDSTIKRKVLVILHFTTNSIKVLDLFGGEVGGDVSKATEVSSVRLGCQALVYAFSISCHTKKHKIELTSSFLHGDSWPSLCVFSGTSFGAIHLFQPAIGPQILRTFIGNNGMPFAIRCDANFRWLFSVGDDRSLRLWDIQNGIQLFNKFGHGARPFALELYENKRLIFTGGMDNYICVWHWSFDEKKVINRLFLARKIDISPAKGEGGTIKCILPLEPARNGTGKEVGPHNLELLIGSDRGTLSAVSLSANLMPFNHSVGIKKVNAFALFRLRGIPFSIFLDKKRTLAVERINNEPIESGQPQFDFINRIRTEFSDSNGLPMVFRSDMFCFSESFCSLALCAESDHSLHLAIFDGCAFRSIRQPTDAQLDQLLWVQPESSKMLLTVSQGGQMVASFVNLNFGMKNLKANCNKSQIVYQIGASFNEKDSNSASFMRISQLQSEKKATKVQVALLIAETSTDLPIAGVFLLGTRSGTLMAFSVQSGKLLWSHRFAHGTNDCEKTVTDLHIEVIKQSERTGITGNLMSMGRDGTLKHWHFQWEQRKSCKNEEKFSLEPFSVRHLPIEWPCKIVSSANSRVFIVGFNSDEFVVMDLNTLFILCTFRCGGGNRKWQFGGGMEDNIACNDSLSFAYTRKGFLHFVLLDAIGYHPIRPFLHSDNIVTMTSLEHNGNALLLSGGSDRRISLSLFSPFNSSVCCVNSSIIHRSNLECIYLVDNWHWHNETDGKGRDKLILSVGGRSEICAWRLHFNTENEWLPQLHFLSSTDLFDNCAHSSDGAPSQDCRLMAVRHFSGLFFAILCSDGSIRFVKMLSHHRHSPRFSPFAKWAIRIPSLAIFTSLELIEHDKMLICSSTDGHLYTFSISEKILQRHFGDSDIGTFVEKENSQSNLGPFYQQQFLPLLVERCGLSSLTIATLSKIDIILTGSESGRINVLEHHQSDPIISQKESTIELLASGDWHASTITALQAVPLSSTSLLIVLSISLDCRLGFGLYDSLRHQLRPLRHVPLCVSDPASLLVLSDVDERSLCESSSLPAETSLRINCFVSGHGIEHVQIIGCRTCRQ